MQVKSETETVGRSLDEWRALVAKMSRKETARQLHVYEGLIIAVCGSHQALLEACKAVEMTEELAELLRAWSKAHVDLIAIAQSRLLETGSTAH